MNKKKETKTYLHVFSVIVIEFNTVNGLRVMPKFWNKPNL